MNMLRGCTSLVKAPELPATELVIGCYGYMFNGCTSLVNAPVLPATELADSCYSGMFNGCTSLVNAPVLPATELADYCYNSMFQGCTSLVNAPVLPATVLANYCYFYMFYGCTLLTTPPALPATELVIGCYSYMFRGCSNLNYVKALFTTTPSSTYTNNWLDGVSSTGTFVKNANATWDVTGVNGVPEGWDILHDRLSMDCNYLGVHALENNFNISFSNDISYSIDNGETWDVLPSNTEATIGFDETILFKGDLTPGSYSGIGTFTINNRCNLFGNILSLLYGDNASEMFGETLSTYSFMNLFRNCSGIIEVSDNLLPSTKLSEGCYLGMFRNCTSLINMPELPATNIGKETYASMFAGCTSLKNATAIKATSLGTSCCEYMFEGCSSLKTAPQIDATSTESKCFRGMFYNCSSLVDAPILAALNVAEYCYEKMFEGCTSLVNAPELPATMLAYNCYSDMFANCQVLVNAPELPATTLSTNCYMYMFYGCRSLRKAPELPATTLVSGCYSGMFQDCSNLNYVKALFTTTPSKEYTAYWLAGVSETGTFVKTDDATWNVTGVNGIPEGWTVESETIKANLADVVYYVNDKVKTVSAAEWDESLGTPIGVVVIPSNLLPDGKARMISLKAVDASGNATEAHSGMAWGPYGVDTTLTNYTNVPITDNTDSLSNTTSGYGYLPSDAFSGTQSFVDDKAYYSTYATSNLIPSPYLGNDNTINPEYSKVISEGNNVLGDFDGLNNTLTLVGLGVDYVAANAAYGYYDGVSNTQWYLPSAGELGFLVLRFNTINSVITNLGGVAVPSYGFWASTEYSSDDAYYVGTYIGDVYGYFKNYTRPYARPFACVG